MKQKVKAHEITRALRSKYCDGLFLTEVKTGPSTMSETLRFDALVIKPSWTKPCFTGYEVKVSRNDFLHDDKFIHYRDYCHRLYMVCPKNMINPEELPDDIGLIYYNPEKETLSTKRIARLREIDIPGSLLYYILISRIDGEKHPFFSSDREYIESYLEDKAEKRILGQMFKSKLISDVVTSNEALNDMERKLKRFEDKANERDEIVKLLEEKGIIGWEYDIVGNLRKALESDYPKELINTINDLYKEIDRAKKIVCPMEG